jgi:hypothetical protein
MTKGFAFGKSTPIPAFPRARGRRTSSAPQFVILSLSKDLLPQQPSYLPAGNLPFLPPPSSD